MNHDPDEIMKQEHRRHKIIEDAMAAADRIVMDRSDGSVEELEFLTAEMAHRWIDKVMHAVRARLHKKELFS